jgi:predicted AlkP superfamily pyrophosphatase or phosphodiesterase
MKRLFSLCIFAVLCLSLPVAAQTTRPIPAIHKVVIISIDGLRPDLALRANTPNLHALMNIGSFTFWARTTAESVTLPSHTSMLTGVTPVNHGIQWNADLPLKHPVYPNFPTLFELAKKVGYTTAMAVGKSKFINLAKPKTLDWAFLPYESKIGDHDVAVQAVSMILAHQPDVLFVHFPGVDNAGHEYGWATPEQMDAIALADESIGSILWALDQRNLRDSTFILVTADHGGAGLGHGPEDPRSRNIPWITVGPGIRKGVDLTTYANLVIDTEDTFSTAAYLLGISIIKKVDGKPVLEIIDRSNQELLHAAR